MLRSVYFGFGFHAFVKSISVVYYTSKATLSVGHETTKLSLNMQFGIF